MRAFMAATGAAVILMTGTACADGNEPSASAGPSSGAVSPTAAGAVAAGGGNTVQVCAAVKQLNTTTSASEIATMKSAFATAAAKETPEGERGKAVVDAGKKITTRAGGWIDDLHAQSSVATDPALAKAIDDLATELVPLRTGAGNLQQMIDAVTKAEAEMAPFCGGDPAPVASSSAAVPAGIGPGTACPAPVAFDTAEKWSPEAISEVSVNREGRALICEIDAKPAGILGFIRVWSVQKTSPRVALDGVIAALRKPTGMKYRNVAAGDKTALEVSYQSGGSSGRAFAVAASSGEIVVTDWKGLDQEEHDAGLKAYELALSSITFP
jgi:hypothetical protein